MAGPSGWDPGRRPGEAIRTHPRGTPKADSSGGDLPNGWGEETRDNG